MLYSMILYPFVTYMSLKCRTDKNFAYGGKSALSVEG